MSAVVPHVSAIYAAAFGLLACALTVRVILHRVRTGIGAGDGGDAPLGRSIRAHGNFAEQAPLALLLIVLAEVVGAPTSLIHALALTLLLSRLAGAWGLTLSTGVTWQRQAGAGLTVLVIVATSLLILYRALTAM